jgi:hypothetical protein
LVAWLVDPQVRLVLFSWQVEPLLMSAAMAASMRVTWSTT